MKRLVSTLLLLFSAYWALGQVGNEWIQHHQPYFKVRVGKTGLYRLTRSALQAAGFPVTSDPRKFQLYHRGVEQSLLVSGEGDGAFDAGDHIEFFGQMNDGTLDSTLYESPSYQPHKYYNLFSDTAAYFLTIGSSAGKRMQVSAGSSAGLVADAHHWSEKLLVLKDNYAGGVDHGSVQKTTFDNGEGWTGSQILHGQEAIYTLSGITDAVTSAGKPVVELALTGRGPMQHNVEVYAGTRLLSGISFQGYSTYRHTQPIEWSDIDGSGALPLRIRVTGSGGADRVSVAFIRLLFPRSFSMASESERFFLVQTNANNSSLIRIANAPAGVRVFEVTSPGEVVQLQVSAGEAVVPSGGLTRKLFATAAPISTSDIRRVYFRNLNPAAYDYVIVTHRSLRRPAMGYLDPVKAFAEYRALEEGGGFDTLVLNIDQVYDQFNFGEVSPRAIYQLMRFFASGSLPGYLFLIGKGLDVNYGYNRNPGAFGVYKDLVPTAGYPASDMAFTAGLGGQPHAPGVATGRLTANSPADVAVYLNKVKQQAALPFTDLGRKRILHLSGGIEESEPAYFRDILRSFEALAEDRFLGGQVQAISKQSFDVRLINIAEEVNKGLGLITFFGHSAPNTLDFDIGLVSDPVMGYDNKGRYPFLLMNGCDAGSFFLNTSIIGENWISTPDKGAVGFIAHSSYGLVSGLQRYSSIFYDVAFGDSVYINKGVGMVQREVARRYLLQFGESALGISQVQQMVLLGDPAVKIFGAGKPDYSFVPEGITVSSYDDTPVTALSDSFSISIPVKNTGIASSEKLRMNIIRTFNGGQTTEYDSIIPSVLFLDTISFRVRNSDRDGYGINTFVITIDADGLAEELDETNNTFVFDYFIPLNSTRNLYPYNFGIVNSREVALSFQYTDPLADPRQFILEIDTTDTFSSGFRKEFVIATDILGRQSFNLLDRDSTVYYWRTKIADPSPTESTEWAASSFTYIAGDAQGWAQVHSPQFQRNDVSGLVIDAASRRIRFEETVSDLFVRTFTAASGKPQDSVSFKVNGVEFNLMHEGGACRNNTINLIAFDRRSTQPYAGIYFKWYEILYDYGGRRLLCGREPYVINSFAPQELHTGNGDDLIQYVDNIATGDSVVLFNIGDAGFDLWPQAAKDKLASLGIGSSQLSDLGSGDAVIIFGRKGASPGTADVLKAAVAEDRLTLSRTIAGRFTSGSMSSGLIGPAQRWNRFEARVKEVEAPDSFRFSLIGIDVNGQQDTLKANAAPGDDLSFVDAGQYPRMRVVFETTDDIDLTAAQLPQWLVLFEPVAEGLLFYNDSIGSRTVSEGEIVTQAFGFMNISDQPFTDSVTVQYNLVRPQGPRPAPMTTKIAPPPPNDTTLFTVQFSTRFKGGMNDIEIFANPHVLAEKNYDNNVIALREYVEVLTDRRNPVLEVLFGGRQLEDGDFVPASPSITVRLWDENPFILKQDTLAVRIFMAFPCGDDECVFEPVYFSRADVTWSPATADSDFQVSFSPASLPPGLYRLRVEAEDASGNAAGAAAYEISFRVAGQETMYVTEAYPNPFSAETSIDVVVPGPAVFSGDYTLSITAVDGRLVAEISSDGGLHVGRNSIVWNGQAADGRSVPGGIYFYRLKISGPDGSRQISGKLVLAR